MSRTLVFGDPRRVRIVFEQLLSDNLDLGTTTLQATGWSERKIGSVLG